MSRRGLEYFNGPWQAHYNDSINMHEDLPCLSFTVTATTFGGQEDICSGYAGLANGCMSLAAGRDTAQLIASSPELYECLRSVATSRAALPLPGSIRATMLALILRHDKAAIEAYSIPLNDGENPHE